MKTHALCHAPTSFHRKNLSRFLTHLRNRIRNLGLEVWRDGLQQLSPKTYRLILRWRNRSWYNGSEEEIYSKREAIAMTLAGLGMDRKLFELLDPYISRKQRIHDWIFVVRIKVDALNAVSY